LETALAYFNKSDMDLTILDDNEDVFGLSANIEYKEEKQKDNPRVVFFVMYVSDRADIGTVAHEAVHTANFIFEYLGQEADQKNDEMYAYLVGHLTKVFLEKIRGVEKKDRALVIGEKLENLRR
jgi:hypothetical protein